MMTLARHAGFTVPDFELVAVGEVRGLPRDLPGGLPAGAGQAYAVRRFDRDGDTRIHIEDMAQAFGVYPSEKYKAVSYRNIAELVWREAGAASLQEFIGRLVFNAAIGNGDMHAKNWSLIYPDGRTPALAPAYDFVSTLAYIQQDGMALNLVGTRSFREFDEARLLRLADKAQLPAGLVRRAGREAAERTRQAWHELGTSLPLPVAVRSAVDAQMTAVPLLAGPVQIPGARLGPEADQRRATVAGPSRTPPA